MLEAMPGPPPAAVRATEHLRARREARVREHRGLDALGGALVRGLGRRRAPVPGGHDAGKATLENGSADLAFLFGIRGVVVFNSQWSSV